jgi:hypothetical protein
MVDPPRQATRHAREASASAAIALLLAAAGCLPVQDPASYVNGLRVLAVKADPPEVGPGHSATLTALAVDTQGRMIDIAWAECTDPPKQGEAVNPDCITNDTADYLTPIGNGLTVTAEMPSVNPFDLGLPDPTDGFYLPIRGRASAGTDSLTAVYRLRYLLLPPANQNPQLTGVLHVISSASGDGGGAPDGGAADVTAPFDDANPIVVHAGDEVTLRATFTADSAETYLVYDGDPRTTPPRMAKEQLSVAWFSTAGAFSEARSGVDRPDIIFHLDTTRNNPVHVPTAPGPIDLWLVARDERGGTDYMHRVLMFQ